MKNISSSFMFSVLLSVGTFCLLGFWQEKEAWAKSFEFDLLGTVPGSPQAPSLTRDGDMVIINQASVGAEDFVSAVIGDNKVVEVFSSELIESEEAAMFSNAVINDNHFIAYQSEQFGQPAEIRVILPDTLGTHATPLAGNDFRLLGMDNLQRLLVRGTENLPGGGHQTALNLYDSSGSFLVTVTNDTVLGTDTLDYDSVFFSRNSGAISFVQRDPGFGGGHSRIMQYFPGSSPIGGELVHQVDGTVFLDEPSINMARQVAFIEGTPGPGPGTGTGEVVRLYNPFDALQPLKTVLAVDDFTLPGGQFVRFNEVALNNQGKLFVFGELGFGPPGTNNALAVYDIYTEEFNLVIHVGQAVFGVGEITDLRWDQYGINELGSMAVTAKFDTAPLLHLMLTIVEVGEGLGLHPSDPIIPGEPKTIGVPSFAAAGSAPPPNTPPACVPVEICTGAAGPSGKTFFVQDGPPLWVDPEPAIGFEYQFSEGEPNFASIVVPEQENVGDGVYTLRFVNDAGLPVEYTIATLERFFFTDVVPGGVARFTIEGIEFDETITTLGSETALGFVAGLTWMSLPSAQAVITITPFVSIPEPSTVLLMSIAVACLCSRRRVNSPSDSRSAGP